MRIAFFDSGIGGLTVMAEAMQRIPQADYIYYADTDNVPYGKKSAKEIEKLVDKAVAFLMTLQIDILVIACNTATSVSVKKLRKKYDLPIIGMEPAVKPAVRITDKKRSKILVCATKLTLKQQKLKDLIYNLKARDKTILLSLQKLVKYSEEERFEGKAVEKYLTKKFQKIKWEKISVLVLGCTHFLYFKNVIRKMIPEHVTLVDGNTGTVNRILHFYEKNNENKKVSPTLRFFQSGREQDKSVFDPYLKFYNNSK